MEPAKEAHVVLAPLRRHAPAEEHPAEARRALRPLRVPRVAPAVPVGVPEVVGLPGVRRDHDRDSARRAERGRPDDERRVADPAVVRRQLHEVDTRRPGADRKVERRSAVSGRPGNRHGLVHRHAVHQRVAVRRAFLRPRAERLQRQRLGIGLDRQAGGAGRDVALGGEARVDAEDSHDRRLQLPAAACGVVAVRAPVAGRVGRRDPYEVRARAHRPVREPGERVPARPQVRGQLVDRLRGADRRRHLEVHDRALAERERDLGRLAQLVPVRGDRRHAGLVALERLAAAVVGGDVHRPGRDPVDRDGGLREDPQAVDQPDLVLAVRHLGAAETAVPAQRQEAAPLRLGDPADRFPGGRRELNTHSLRRRKLRVDRQPLRVGREVARHRREVGRACRPRESKREQRHDQHEAAHPAANARRQT